MIFLEPS